jgi:hypothetical protein
MEIPARKTRRDLHMAALLFGSIGLIELGWMWMESINASPCGIHLTKYYFSIPSLLGFTLGLIAIIKNAQGATASSGEELRAANRIGGKWLAIFGVIASAPGLLLTISSLPSSGLYHSPTPGRNSAAVQTLRTIYIIQSQYYATHSRFATMEELDASGMIDSEYASRRPIFGYIYSSSDITTKTYCVHADRANGKCGYRDFVICEDGVIRFIESESKGAVRRGEWRPMGASH